MCVVCSSWNESRYCNVGSIYSDGGSTLNLLTTPVFQLQRAVTFWMTRNSFVFYLLLICYIFYYILASSFYKHVMFWRWHETSAEMCNQKYCLWKKNRLLQPVLLCEVPHTYRSGQHCFSFDGTVIVLWMCLSIGSLRTYTILWFIEI